MRLFTLVCFISVVNMYAQYEYLDPANYPNDMACDTMGLGAAFEQHWRGLQTYKVHLTPTDPDNPNRYLSPVIDGTLEPEIWSYSDTLIIGSWEMAGLQAACVEKSFYGTEDLFAIWRFMYNQDGLFVSCQVHDDVHDIDSIGGWYSDDGLEIIIDPYDWGDFQSGNWAATPPSFYRYNDPDWIIDPGPVPNTDPRDTVFIYLMKRLNEEPYVAGLIHEVFRTNCDKGQEATNFTKGNLDIHGIDFAAACQSIDGYFREVWHFEMMFPFPRALAANSSDLWQSLAGPSVGFFDQNGLPKRGSVFKMAFQNNDDDMPGPDGEYAAISWNSTKRWPEFYQEASGHDGWRDTKYSMVFEYEDHIGSLVAKPFEGCSSHGDRRIIGPWVVDGADSLRIYFTGSGTVRFDTVSYWYDSTSSEGGVLLAGNDSMASYVLRKGRNRCADTLFLDGGIGSWILTRYISKPLCSVCVQGRWVESQWVEYRALCSDSVFYGFRPVPAARQILSNPASEGYTDSLYIADSLKTVLEAFAYDYCDNIFISGSDTLEMKLSKLVDLEDSYAPVQIIAYWRGGDSVVFEKILPFDLRNIGETNYATRVNSAIVCSGSNTITVNPITLVVISKYTPDFRMKVNGTLRSYLVYPDILIDKADSALSPWQKPAYYFASTADSFAFVDYNPITRTGSGHYTHDSLHSFADSSWVVTTDFIYITDTLESATDTFSFTDTVQVQAADPFAPNFIDTNVCPVKTEMFLHTKSREILLSVFPNPFNPSVNFTFSLPPDKALAAYALRIYNARGQLIRTALSGTVGQNGLVNKQVTWDGTNSHSDAVGSGVYFYVLNCGAGTRRGNIVLLK
ncbi:MAG: hypothetical protein A2268_08700 [Candidatus Raymondbacteria bacterium RifOxyA12_full_50_37]|uniref:FlgD Ig-like domain-containing protein n=1 Tax=Candidatus Raymondbacteria bacterium RIFOXYD12_FULL_49_13 TaxID=1817890 RepID=A0A1F7FLG7_UNCRA|nr:MAG: hypothetical protein A2268_08700 [Candidatus Raymondbacteria bacterium RifOxyA12_full_50_37]OGJ93327.1 MAG: hypothetical protein A2248_07930 [Candidatus Raymondbacteria bacterium RIFOXYA2_FULL_49_16]OGJ95203.1 MAG: hypothetical protein A2453_12040 [Candidatus Raymondbacteria bacterium RIFOXYC2_FULL_50_21]OGK03812.1 MAG: hypothetical protein A2350_00760 [Candidatus Raymondbacteria bacterium RifOxyB12_full_50_8]OGK06914.1 MAG: hypothetical protein A2487_14485 [Candidatus Raymondbacteria b